MDFWKEVAQRQASGQRLGQAVFNTAAEKHPYAARLITASENDCFYRDEKIPLFLPEFEKLSQEYPPQGPELDN